MKLDLLVCVACLLFVWTVSYFIPYKNDERDYSSVQMANFIPTQRDLYPTTTFYAHGDVPYTRIQSRMLRKQMLSIPDDAEFIIHVGDIRMGGKNRSCIASEYENAATLLRFSPVPVFIIIGDNDVVDCPNPRKGMELWRNEFLRFESRYWNHSLNVHSPDAFPENFSFQHKDVLFIGVNVVGEQFDDEDIEKVAQRLTDQVNWVMDVIRDYQKECISVKKIIGRVVLFYHAQPGPPTRPFFKPLRHFIGNDLNHMMPILFLNGDAHKWSYSPRFYNETSLLRVTVTGLGVEPLLKVSIASDGIYHDPTETFVLDRRLSLLDPLN
jgi:hypothetical protein